MKKLFSLIVVGLLSCNSFADVFLPNNHSHANANPFVRIHGLPGFSGSDTLSAGQFESQIDLEISNEFHLESSDSERVFLDYERSQLNISFEYGIKEDTSIGIVLPYISNSGGFMDGLIENWHDLFGLPQGGRDDAPDDEFTISYRNAEQTLFLDKTDEGIGDVYLFLAKKLTETDEQKLNARVNLKLPTGDEDQLFGSGGYSFSTSLNGFKRLTEKWQVYGMVGLSYLQDSEILPELQTNLVGSVVIGVVWQMRSHLSLVAQLDFNSEVYDQTDLDAINGKVGVLVISAAYQFSDRASLVIGFNEDVINKDAAPDFGVNLGFRYQP